VTDTQTRSQYASPLQGNAISAGPLPILRKFSVVDGFLLRSPFS